MSGHEEARQNIVEAGDAEGWGALLCSRFTTDTGSIVELWELDNGTFEMLFLEAHLPDEVVYALTLRPVEAELIAGKLVQAAGAMS